MWRNSAWNQMAAQGPRWRKGIVGSTYKGGNLKKGGMDIFSHFNPR